VIQRILRGIHWHLVTKTLWLLFVLPARRRVLFVERPPRKGGFILATNHVSHFDPPLITISFPRRIDWIAIAELFNGRFLNAFFTGLNVIPVDRSGADRNALRTAVKRLKEGRVVGIFPEGGIRDGEKSIVNGASMKQGLALLSAMSGAPILPGVILGSDRFYNAKNWFFPWRRTAVWIAFGKPITHPEGLSGDALRKYLQETFAQEIITLKDRLRRDFDLKEADMPHSPQQRMAEP
jgi:1-acyl-sn-glycerol-3-phosphate acyltransferase